MNIDEYEHGGRALYAEFATEVGTILRAAIGEHSDLRLQNIQSRAKDVASLRAKLARADTKPEDRIADIAKDVAGCRIIFYTNGDVYRFSQSGILRENFVVDYERSKIHYPQNSEESTEFFISENWVVELTEVRCALPEYRRFAGLRCEIQVQTILDHAWAEMAHDTIYKPMNDVGFGAAAVDAMRKRLRKVMREYLQPAGYEFQKIASDYSRLLEGKSMFEEDALAVIRNCQDRNCLHDVIERFESHVLPHYDDFRAWGPEIIDTLSDAAVRAVAMPNVPHKGYFGEYPGTKVEIVLGQICRVLQTGYLLYNDPDRMFDAIVAMRAATSGEEQSKPVDELTHRFSRHDRRAWQHAGPSLQRMLVDRISAMDNAAIVSAAAVVTPMLREALSSTVSGETWSAEAVTLHTGSVIVSDALITMRRDALNQLKRLHALLAEGQNRVNVRHAMTAVGNTPNNAGYSDTLGVVIMDDLADVVSFFAEIAPALPLEPKRHLEIELFRIFYCYHVLPPAMAKIDTLAAAQGRLLEAIAACRAIIDGDEDFGRYCLLVGFDNVSRRMWENASYDYEATAAERSQAIDGLVATVSEETSAKWLVDLDRYVETRSEDLAMFQGFEEFIGKVAAKAPAVLIAWLPQLSERLTQWLPGMFHGLATAEQGQAIEPLIEQWVAEGRHLASIAWYLQATESFRFDLLLAITNQALAANDDHTLGNVAIAAARQSEKHPDGLFDRIFLPAAQSLESRGDHRWVGGMINWKSVGLLKGLDSAQVDALLPLLVGVPRLAYRGEEMVAVIAEEHPDAVLAFLGMRIAHDRSADAFRYEDIPHSFVYLATPLAKVPEKVVAAARAWFDTDKNFSEFRGGRLISQLFPNLEEPMPALLQKQIESGQDGIEFSLSVLRAYEGQAFLHPLLKEAVVRLAPDDGLLGIVGIVIDSTGVLTGEHGSVEAQEQRKALVAKWENDEREPVRAFAAKFLKTAENQLAWERRRADANVAMRKMGWDE